MSGMVAPNVPIVPTPVISPGWVYFIQEGPRGLVKIGWARHPFERLQIIQAGNSRRLHMRKKIASLSQDYEFELHKFYKEHRVVREWFRAVVLDIEPPAPAQGHPVREPVNLPPRFCGNCRVRWEDHDDEKCPDGWLPPEVVEYRWKKRVDARVTRSAA